MINGYPFNSDSFNTEGHGYPVIKIKEMKKQAIQLSKDTCYSEYNPSLQQYVLNRDDILIALTGNPPTKGTTDAMVGRCSRYNLFLPSLLNQRVCKVISSSEELLNEYLYYFLSLESTTTSLASRCSGSANQANISSNDIKDLEITLPSVGVQQHIVNTIGTIDDLIENCQEKVSKIIKLGDLLLICNSYKEPICKYANISLGGTPSRKHPEYWNGNIKWINSGAITGVPAILFESELITADGVKHSATKPANKGDSILSIIEPSKNKVALILDNDVYFNQSVICISPKNENGKGLMFFASRYLIDEIKGYATGAAQQSLNKDMVEKADILVPNLNVIEKLNDLALEILCIEEKIRKLKSIKLNLLSKYF